MCKRNLKKLALNLPPSTSEEVIPPTPIVMSNDASDQRAYYNAHNANQLTRHGITCVINVASEIDLVSLPQHIEYHHIKWTHSQLDLAKSEFDRAIALIHMAHDRNQTVMIHCQQGIERSAALVVAFLIKSTHCTKRINAKVDKDALAGQNWSFDRALDFVKEKAPRIRPNMELLYQLREYEQLLPIEQQYPYQLSATAEKRHSIRNRTKRSESIACSKPSTRNDAPLTSSTSLRSLNKTMYLQRPRSASVRDTSSSANLAFANTPSVSTATESNTSFEQIDKQSLAIAALIIVFVALHQRECYPSYRTNNNKCDPNDSNDALNTAIGNSDNRLSNNNSHLSSQFLKPVFPIY
ncbi:hypothetical protein PS6_004437 [Mucor atramentarius]